MKITSKIKKQINQVARIIRYGIEWGEGNESDYQTGSAEGTCFAAACFICTDIYDPNGIDPSLATSDLIDSLNLDDLVMDKFEGNLQDEIEKRLTVFIKKSN